MLWQSNNHVIHSVITNEYQHNTQLIYTQWCSRVIPVYCVVIIQVYTQNNNVIHQLYTCVHTSVFLENTTVIPNGVLRYL